MGAALRELIYVATMRAEDRSMGSTRRGKHRVFVGPRLAFFLTRRRMAQIKDTSRYLLLERPSRVWRQFRTFLREEEITLTDLMYAVGFLVKATVYPAAALLLAIACLLATLNQAGLP